MRREHVGGSPVSHGSPLPSGTYAEREVERRASVEPSGCALLAVGCRLPEPAGPAEDGERLSYLSR